jgi:hypothetical protein
MRQAASGELAHGCETSTQLPRFAQNRAGRLRGHSFVENFWLKCGLAAMPAMAKEVTSAAESISTKAAGSRMQAAAFRSPIHAGIYNSKGELVAISVRDQGSSDSLQLISMTCHSKMTRLL